tara:strand:- start:150 stop:389 length:240 start_codon:yes stop_codon:yes gene_type:complete
MNIDLPPSIPLKDLESAINYWRSKSPSVGEECRLCAEAAALATPYALMILGHQESVGIENLSDTSRAAMLAWYQAVQRV